MRRFLILVAAARMVNACATAENLRPNEKAVWIPVRHTSYSKVFEVANKVMAKHLHLIQSNQEIGTVKGVTSNNSWIWKEAAGIYVWPTSSNDYGYFVSVDAMTNGVYFEPPANWQKIIVDDLKKELGVI